MKKCWTYLLIIILWSFISCDNSDDYTRDPKENFEALWKIMDEHYCFFEYKQIDWDEVHARYSLLITDTMDQFQLFYTLGEMLAELKDGHTNLISSFDVSRYWAWYEEYPPNYYKEIHDSYLGISTEYHQAGGMKYKLMADDKIGYMYYGSFSNGVGDSNIDYIFHHFKDCKGIILDIRENGGGSLTYSDRIASRFLEEKTLVGYMSHKVGKGHNDFSTPYPVYLTPSTRTRWFRPVIVLTNRHCYSAANDFVQKMRMMPQVTIMGDRTGGGSGFPFHSELPIGWNVRFSSSPMLDADKQQTEFGIDPDIKVSFTGEDIMKGKDALIDAAIQYILSLPEKQE